jgi:hypothetical protein
MEESASKSVLRRAVGRILLIKDNLSRLRNAFEIMQLLKGLQLKYNSPVVLTNSEEANKKTLEMLQVLTDKFEDMKKELYDQKIMIRAQTMRGKDGPQNFKGLSPKSIRPINKKFEKKDSLGIFEDSRKYMDSLNLSKLDEEDEDSKASHEDKW